MMGSVKGREAEVDREKMERRTGITGHRPKRTEEEEEEEISNVTV